MSTAQSLLLNASPLSVVDCVAHALYTWLCGLLGNVPFLHKSTQRPPTLLHVMSFTRPSPALVLQATNAGVRRLYGCIPLVRATNFLLGSGRVIQGASSTN